MISLCMLLFFLVCFEQTQVSTSSCARTYGHHRSDKLVQFGFRDSPVGENGTRGDNVFRDVRVAES